MNGYTFSNNTYSKVAKDNPKDRIAIEIGDSKQPDFKPQVKIQRSGDFKKGMIPWNRGITGYSTSWKGGKMSIEAKIKMSEKAKMRLPKSEETKRKISEALKGRMPKNLHLLDNSGANSHWWKGGITPENERIRKSTEYALWRTAVFIRDDYACVIGGKAHGRKINADHIKPFALYPDLRLAIDNGRTLCVDCHKQTETYGRSVNAGNRYN